VRSGKMFIMTSQIQHHVKRWILPVQCAGTWQQYGIFWQHGTKQQVGYWNIFCLFPVDFLKFDVAYTIPIFSTTLPTVWKALDSTVPRTHAYAEAAVKFLKHFTVTLNAQYQSKWCIQVDDSIYNHFNENGVIRSSLGERIYGDQCKLKLCMETG